MIVGVIDGGDGVGACCTGEEQASGKKEKSVAIASNCQSFDLCIIIPSRVNIYVQYLDWGVKKLESPYGLDG